MLKAVIDANVWISVLLAAGNSHLILEALKKDLFELIYPPELLTELVAVLARPRLEPDYKAKISQSY